MTQSRMLRTSPLTPAIALLLAVLLAFAGIALALYVDSTYRAQKTNEAEVQAQIVASAVTAALAFDDPRAAHEYVDAIRANPEVRSAAVYGAHGALFASYPRNLNGGPVVAVRSAEHFQRDGILHVLVPVMQRGTYLGTVELQTILEPVGTRIERYGVIALLVTLAALVIGVLALAQAALGRANKDLADKAADLALANTALHDEIVQREKAEEALRQAQKMEAVGQLTGGIAHDFNNLLQVVLACVDRMRRQAARSGTAQQAIPDFDRLSDAALRAAQRGATLTRRLLAFSRRQSLAPKPVDVNKLVVGMSDLLLRTVGEGVHIETVLTGGVWRAFADENQLESALLNLVVNARDAMSATGKLTIETSNAFLDEAYARSEGDLKAGQYVLLAVSDTGIGMTPEILAQVFEPFFTTKGIGEGTGLGLSQVYGFIKQSGGHVRIYSEPGRGTTVKLYLPRVTESPAAPEPEPEKRRLPSAAGKETILVVEDEDDVRALTVQTLTDLGYQIVQAPEGSTALKLLDLTPEVKLLFTDVGLPGGMNGRQLADAARTRRPDLRVLFTTGYARNAIVHQGRLDPGVQLISKPFSDRDLAARIRDLLDETAPSAPS